MSDHEKAAALIMHYLHTAEPLKLPVSEFERQAVMARWIEERVDSG